jgi:hypothetical protein
MNAKKLMGGLFVAGMMVSGAQVALAANNPVSLDKLTLVEESAAKVTTVAEANHGGHGGYHGYHGYHGYRGYEGWRGYRGYRGYEGYRGYRCAENTSKVDSKLVPTPSVSLASID